MNEISLTHRLRFRILLPLLLQRSLLISLGLILISCATLPQQTYLTNKNLLGISKVAIVVSAGSPEVSYASTEPVNINPILAVFAPLLVLPAMGIEASAHSSTDQEHSAKIKEQMNLSLIEDTMGRLFVKTLSEKRFFSKADYIKERNIDTHQLSVNEYDAVIRLQVSKISIERIAGDYVRLYVTVRGYMEKLESGKIMWEREEIVSSNEPQPLTYYKENGLKELDTLLAKATNNLTYDFIYLK
jgi:hypothetical protein